MIVLRLRTLYKVWQGVLVMSPCLGAEIDRLVADKDIAQLCPYYVDLQVEGPRLQAIVNKMKSISSTLTLVTTKHGHLHLQVAAEQARLQG